MFIMANSEELTKVGMTVVCSFALLFVAYSLVESIRDNGFFFTSTKKKWVEKKEGETNFRKLCYFFNTSPFRSPGGSRSGSYKIISVICLFIGPLT